MSKIFLPETEPEKIDKSLHVNKESIGVNVIDALASGAADGLKLALNIGGMLLAFIAVIYALNWMLVDGIGAWTGLNEPPMMPSPMGRCRVLASRAASVG